MVAIELENIDLTFRVHRQLTLKEFLLTGMFRKKNAGTTPIQALKNVNLRIKDGERVGIIGGNGSGKSSLLRLLSGVYYPTSGKRLVTGRISSLFELTLGFEHLSNGWDNIYFRGYLQGETPKSLKAKVKGIADFTELKEFLDVPVRFYSAGMLVRLAFAIATASDPEILLIDEVLFAGDLAFRNKARARMTEMMEKARVMLLVSHDLDVLPSFCERAIWMEKGVLRMDGPIDEVISAYRAQVGGAKKAVAA